MIARHLLHSTLLPMLSAGLAVACAAQSPRGVAPKARDYAYVRARDSLVVAVSGRGRSGPEVQQALQSAALAAAKLEGCEPGTVETRGDADPRLAADAVAYVRAPRWIGVASCQDPIAVLRPTDLAALRWIVGSWRGSGDGQAPFYERYRFVDDSTLLVESFRDSTLAEVSESTRYELRGGRLANVSTAQTAQWAAVRLDRGAITFAPVRGARNRFTWRPESADVWIADLAWPASNAALPRTRSYRMVRWTPAR